MRRVPIVIEHLNTQVTREFTAIYEMRHADDLNQRSLNAAPAPEQEEK